MNTFLSQSNVTITRFLFPLPLATGLPTGLLDMSLIKQIGSNNQIIMAQQKYTSCSSQSKWPVCKLLGNYRLKKSWVFLAHLDFWMSDERFILGAKKDYSETASDS
jgi:hypothetical protein